MAEADPDEDLLGLAQRSPTDPRAAWAFAGHVKIRGIIGREVARVAWSPSDHEDLWSAITLSIFESAQRARTFEHEGQVVNYWNLRVMHYADAAIRKLRPTGRGDGEGRYYLRESATEAWILENLAGADTSTDEEREERLQVAREVLFSHPDRICADVFWGRCQGLGWRDVCATTGVPDLATARRLYWRFVSDARAVLIELGEAVTLQIAGMHIDERGISMVTIQGRRVLSRWTLEYDDLADLGLIQERVEDECRRGAVCFVSNTLDGDIGTVLKLELVRRGVQLEEFDLASFLQVVDPSVMDRCPGDEDGERWAYLMACAKEAENELKAERL